MSFVRRRVTDFRRGHLDTNQAVELCRQAIILTMLIVGPVLVVAVAVGLLISILQAVTQLQDQTISFVPKIIAMMVAMLYVLPWAVDRMVEYSQTLIRDIPSML